MRPSTKATKSKKGGDKDTSTNRPSDKEYTFSLHDNVYYDTFDDTLCNSLYKKGTIHIDSYEDFEDYLDTLFSKYEPEVPELNYDNMNNISSQGKINKFCNTFTWMSNCRNSSLISPEYRISSGGQYVTYQASTGLLKGSFCYEVIVASPVNDIIVVGFMQDTTSTSEQNKSGVGNTKDSYGFDLKSLRTIHSNKTRYYTNKDINQCDIIGVGITLNKKSSYIEYFLNGESLGKSFLIETGENIAYYPAISLNWETAVFVNFGGTRNLVYDYEEYTPIDKPVSVYSNAKSITKSLLNILKVNGNELLISKEINDISKIQIFGNILQFLAEHSFTDNYLIRRFLFKFISDNFDERIKILERIIKCSNSKELILHNIIDVLISEIEYQSYGEHYDKWKSYMTLLIKFLKTKFIIDPIKSKYINNSLLKKIFKPYRYREHSFEKQLKEFINKNEDIKTSINPQIKYKGFRKKIKLFKGEEFKGYQHSEEQNELFKLLIHALYDIDKGKKLDFFVMDTIKHLKSDSPSFPDLLITLFLNEIDIYFECNDYKNYDNICIQQYLIKDNRNIYEENLGGTRTHVFNTYIKDIPNFSELVRKKKSKSDSILNHLLQLLNGAGIIDGIAASFLRLIDKGSFMEYKNYYSSKECYKVNCLINHFLIFNKTNSLRLNKLLIFLCDFYSYLHSKSLLYFFPIDDALSPYFLLRCLMDEKCFNVHLLNDYSAADYVIHYLFLLLNDDKILNPGIKEDIYEMLSKLILQSKFQVYFHNESLLKLLFNCVIKILKTDYTLDISKFVHFLLCKGKENAKPQQKKLFIKIVEMFRNNKDLFLYFYETYINILNISMTHLTTTLSEFDENHDLEDQVEEIMYYFENLNDTSIIFEFTVENMKVFYEDTNNVEFKLLLNFLVNVSNRILDSNSIERLTKQIVNFHNNVISSLLNSFCTRIMIIFASLDNQFNLQSPFLKNLVSHIELNLFNFTRMFELYQKKIITNNKPELYKTANNFLNALMNLNNSLNVKTSFTPKDWEDIDKNDNICIICYENDISHHFVPCNHGCCLCCLKQYLLTKNFCFMCHQKIERIKEDNSIVINK